MKRGQRIGLTWVLKKMRAGLSPAQISEKYNIPKQSLSYYTDGLKKKGFIRKIKNGLWEVSKDKSEKCLRVGVSKSEKEKQIRGHAFIWKVRFKFSVDWLRRLENKKVPYSLICNKKVARIVLEGRKVWLGPQGVTIYEPRDFMGHSALESKGKAVFELDKIIKRLGWLLELNLEPYKFTTSREHYGLIKNELAKQYNDSGEKLYVRSDDGDVWMWIDNSHGLHELENKEPLLNKKIQDWYNDHRKHNFEITPTFMMNAITQNAQNLDSYARHLQSHVESVQKLGEGVEELTKAIKEIQRNI